MQSTAPTVDEIPQAAALQKQLDALNQAMAMLNVPGAGLAGIMCAPPPPPAEPPPELSILTRVALDPPLTDPQVINVLVNTMSQHAHAIEQELADMGYAVVAETPTPTDAR